MRKVSAENAIFVLAVSIIAILFLNFCNLKEPKKEVCKITSSKSAEALKDGTELLWESLSRQFVSTVSSN